MTSSHHIRKRFHVDYITVHGTTEREIFSTFKHEQVTNKNHLSKKIQGINKSWRRLNVKDLLGSKEILRLLEVSYKFDSIKILGINYSKTYAII